jgi:hypothetical protein
MRIQETNIVFRTTTTRLYALTGKIYNEKYTWVPRFCRPSLIRTAESLVAGLEI